MRVIKSARKQLPKLYFRKPKVGFSMAIKSEKQINIRFPIAKIQLYYTLPYTYFWGLCNLEALQNEL